MKGKGKKPPFDKNNPEFVGYVNHNLTEQEKGEILKLCGESLSYEKALHRMLAEGYKVGTYWREQEECYLVTAYGVGFNNPNRGYAMTFRHKDLTKAMCAHLFVNSVIYEWGEWPKKNGDYADSSW